MTQRLQLKLAGTDDAGTFSGLAATFGPLPDRQGDVILPGAFDATLAAWAQRGFGIPLLWQHDQSTPVGAIQAAASTADGLSVGGRIATSTQPGREAYALAQTGALSMSIGYTIPDGGARYVGDVRVLSAVDLVEISLVSVPANADARITEIKTAYACNTIREFEALAREALGLSSRDAKAVASKAWPVLDRDGRALHREGVSQVTAAKALAVLAASRP